MSYNVRFNRLTNFLIPWRKLWECEVLESKLLTQSNAFLEPYAEIFRLAEPDFLLLDTEHTDSHLPSSLKGLRKAISEQSDIKGVSRPVNYPIHEKKIGQKKQHEISCLIPFLKNKKLKFDQIWDIGSGVGRLAKVLSAEFPIPYYCLDKDTTLQALGRKLHQDSPSSQKVKFIPATLGDSMQIQKDYSLGAISIGLHTCGDLAQHFYRWNFRHKSRYFLNFPCCYARTKQPQNVFLSQHAQRLNPFHTFHSLTLANRSFRKLSSSEFQKKIMVKKFRYTFHFFLLENNLTNDFISTGNGHTKDYQGSFSYYANKMLKRLNLIAWSPAALEQYYRTKEKTVWQLIQLDYLRSWFGPVLEEQLLVDKCLYLEEEGHRTQLFSLFDPHISPRHKGIWAEKI